MDARRPRRKDDGMGVLRRRGIVADVDAATVAERSMSISTWRNTRCADTSTRDPKDAFGARQSIAVNVLQLARSGSARERVNRGP